jgi:hypothetical protein
VRRGAVSWRRRSSVSIAPDLDDEGSEDVRAFFEDNLE